MNISYTCPVQENSTIKLVAKRHTACVSPRTNGGGLPQWLFQAGFDMNQAMKVLKAIPQPSNWQGRPPRTIKRAGNVICLNFVKEMADICSKPSN